MSTRANWWDMRISVIIASLGRYDDLCNTVEELLKSNYGDFELIVSDQNAIWPEDRRSRLEALKANGRVRWLSLGLVGVVRARNLAVAESKGDLLIFVDDDVLIGGPDFLARHARTFANPLVSAVSGRELDGRNMDLPTNSTWWQESPSVAGVSTCWADKRPLEQCLGFDRQWCLQQTEVCIFCTCNASIRREVFLEVGGFDEQFGGNSYGDDYDLALRLHQAGFRLFYNPLPVLIHLRTPIGGLRVSDPNNPFTHKEKALSRMLFFLRYRDQGDAIRMFIEALRMTVFTRSNFGSLRRFVAACHGTWRAWVDAARYAKSPCHSIFTDCDRTTE
jgi:GT2 family glycosyltransferase